MTMCGDTKDTSQGRVVCQRPPHPEGSYHQDQLTTSDGTVFLARWFVHAVHFTQIGK